MTIIAFAVIGVAFAAAWAWGLTLRHRRSLIQMEYDERERQRSAESTRQLFAAEERKANQQKELLGELELEVARKQNRKLDYEIQQTKLAQAVVDKIGTPIFGDLMKGQGKTMAEMMQAVTRQLNDQKRNGEQKELVS